jgi:hypothetical protein
MRAPSSPKFSGGDPQRPAPSGKNADHQLTKKRLPVGRRSSVAPRWSLLANHSLRPISGQHNFVRAGQIVVTHGDASELIGQLDQVRAVPPRMGAPSVAAPAQREDFTQGRLPVHGVRRRYVQDGERVAVPSGTPGSALRRGRTRGPPLRGAAGVPSWQPAASSATHASL